MEGKQAWKTRLSFKNATIILCFFNLIAALLLLQGIFTGADRRGGRAHQSSSAQIRYIMESEEIRHAVEPSELLKIVSMHRKHAQIRYIMEFEEVLRAMEPLIKRASMHRKHGNHLKEIEQEVYTEPETEIKQVPKQTAAVDLSKRLKDLRAMNDANSQKALEEWRKQKMERARQ